MISLAPSPLSATFGIRPVGFTFPEPLVETWNSVPGFRAKVGMLNVPWSGRALAWTWARNALAEYTRLPGRDLVETWPYGVRPPRPFGSSSPDELRAAILDSPVKNWLVGRRTFPPHLDLPDKPFGLLAYQVEALWFALELQGGIWDQAGGAGKTVQALIWLALGPPGPCLVVTKRAVALQLTRQASRFLATSARLLPPPSGMQQRQGEKMRLAEAIAEYVDARAVHGERPILVTTWDSLRAHGDALLRVADERPFTSVLFDECHLAKSKDRTVWRSTLRGAQRDGFKQTRSAYAWRLASAVPRRLGMSATIVFDRRSDLYGQFTLVEPAGWGQTGTKYGLRYCGGTPGRGGSLDVSGTSNTEELLMRMAALVHHTPKAVSHAGLPPVHLITRHVPPERQAHTQGFRKIIRYWSKLAGRGDAGAASTLRELEVQEAAARKRPDTLEAIREELEQAGWPGPIRGDAKGKIIVFTGRHLDCWQLYQDAQRLFPDVQTWCGLREAGVGAATDDEEAPPSVADLAADRKFSLLADAERLAVQDAYMVHPGPCLLIATGYAWGTGLDLQDSDALILNMLPYSPGDFDQWRTRIERHGMTRACKVILAIAEGTADVRIAETLAEKTPDVERLTGQVSLRGLVRSLRGMDRKDEILDGLVARLNALVVDWEDEEGEWQRDG